MNYIFQKITDEGILNCKTVSGPNTNAKCIFPFKYREVTYHQCTTADNSAPWCSTLVDDSGKHIGAAGNWGNCGPDCHFDLSGNLCLFFSLMYPKENGFALLFRPLVFI